MNQQQVAVLLALANGHDQRHGIDDVKVQAWHALFQQECPDLDADFAARKVNEYYARNTQMLMPSHIVTAWKQQKTRDRERNAIPVGHGVPMPDYVREQISRLSKHHD